MKKKYVIILLAAVSIVLFLLDYFILPEMVVIQVGLDGKPTTVVSKLIASFIPVILGVIGTVTYKTGEEKKGVIISAVGYAAAIITVLMNLK